MKRNRVSASGRPSAARPGAWPSSGSDTAMGTSVTGRAPSRRNAASAKAVEAQIAS